jgi:hypothetical protein
MIHGSESAEDALCVKGVATGEMCQRGILGVCGGRETGLGVEEISRVGAEGTSIFCTRGHFRDLRST